MYAMETPREATDVSDSGKQALLTWSLLATGAGLIPTLYAAAISNSVVLLADLLRCAADFIAILFSWIIVRKISGADRVTYNYGFGKLEQLSTVAVSGALIITVIISSVAGVRRFLMPEPVENAEFGLLLALLSVLGNGFLWAKNYFHDKRSPSPIIDSQWRLFRAKTFATVVVSISIGVALFTGNTGWTIYIDPTGSIVLAGFMLYSAIIMLSSAVPVLVDRAVEEEIQKIIMSSLSQHAGDYLILEKIRTRRSGKRIFIDIFVMFDGDERFSKIHSTVMRIKDTLRGNLPDAEILVVPSVREQAE